MIMLLIFTRVKAQLAAEAPVVSVANVMQFFQSTLTSSPSTSNDFLCGGNTIRDMDRLASETIIHV